MTHPPITWFRDPQLAELTPLTIGDDGRVYGHLAAWNTPHRGVTGQRVTPPRSRTDYRGFHVGTIRVAGDDGQPVTVSAGVLTVGCGHADTSLDRAGTLAHYDHAGSIFAQVCCGEDAYGVWFAGALMPGLDELTLRRAQACGLSGDWRFDAAAGGLELCAVLAVPVPGFPVPRARVASGAPLALVAAGALVPARQLPFARRVDTAWSGGGKTPAVSVVGILAAGDSKVQPITLAGRITDRATGARVELGADGTLRLYDAAGEEVDLRGRAAAAHAALLADVDDRPALVAALLAEVDDRPGQFAQLLDELAEDAAFDVSRMPEQLKQVWLHGEIAARIGWGTPGSFARCQAIAREKGIPGHQIDGLCANLYEAATGKHPGPRRD